MLAACVAASAILAGCAGSRAKVDGHLVPTTVPVGEATPTMESRPARQVSPSATPTAPRAAGVAASAQPVTVHINGNLFLRRGPDLAFNQIGVLTQGETVVPTARDVLGKWVRVALPTDPPRNGWFSIMTDFTEVAGDVAALQEVEPTEWPELASVRNCTYHEMLIDPGGTTVPAVLNFPNNDVRLNPGSYVILDLEVDGYPEVMRFEIREGATAEITLDGSGEKKKCPET